MLVAPPGQPAKYTTAAASGGGSGGSGSLSQKVPATTSTVTSISNINANGNNQHKFTLNAIQRKSVFTRGMFLLSSNSSSAINESNRTGNGSGSDCNGRNRQIFSDNSQTGTSSLMKSLTVRLNRSTETLKATVQKALVSASVVSSISNNRTMQFNNWTKLLSGNNHKLNNSSTTLTTSTTIPSSLTTKAISNALKYSGDNCNNAIKDNSLLKTGAAPININNNNKSNSMLTTNRNNNNNHNSNSSKYASMSFLKLYTIPPTIYHRYPNEYNTINDKKNTKITITNSSTKNDKRSDSTDSLHMEMCHFKPIRSAPVISWKSVSKTRGHFIRFPKALKPIATRLNCDVQNKEKMETKHFMDKDNHNNNKDNDGMNDDKLKPKLSSSTVLLTRLLTATRHRSAFVRIKKNQVKKPVKRSERMNNKNRFDNVDNSNSDDILSVGKNSIASVVQSLTSNMRTSPVSKIQKVRSADSIIIQGSVKNSKDKRQDGAQRQANGHVEISIKKEVPSIASSTSIITTISNGSSCGSPRGRNVRRDFRGRRIMAKKRTPTKPTPRKKTSTVDKVIMKAASPATSTTKIGKEVNKLTVTKRGGNIQKNKAKMDTSKMTNVNLIQIKSQKGTIATSAATSRAGANKSTKTKMAKRGQPKKKITKKKVTAIKVTKLTTKNRPRIKTPTTLKRTIGRKRKLTTNSNEHFGDGESKIITPARKMIKNEQTLSPINNKNKSLNQIKQITIDDLIKMEIKLPNIKCEMPNPKIRRSNRTTPPLTRGRLRQLLQYEIFL